jgi:ribokinase
MKKWDVIVIGGANTDFLIRGPKLPAPGETVDGETFLSAPGGKGANQAVAAARLGARVAFVGCLGADSRGTELIKHLRRDRVEVRRVKRHPHAPTGAALVMVDDQAEKQILTAPGANHRLAGRDIVSTADLLADAEVLLIQFETPMPSVLKAVQLAHQHGAKVVLDPAPAATPPRKLLPLVDLIRPNAAEAQALTGIKPKDAGSARRAARKLMDSGVGAVCLAAGNGGNLMLWPDGECWLPQLSVKSIDATGAGDAFAAGLAVGLAAGHPYKETGAFANAAAALATTKLGAQPAMPTRGEVLSLLRGAGYKREAAAFRDLRRLAAHVGRL